MSTPYWTVQLEMEMVHIWAFEPERRAIFYSHGRAEWRGGGAARRRFERRGAAGEYRSVGSGAVYH